MTDKQIKDDIIADNCSNGLVYKQLDGLKVGDIYKYDPHRFSPYYKKYVISFLHINKTFGGKFVSIIFEDGEVQNSLSTDDIKKDTYVETVDNWVDAFNLNKLKPVLKEHKNE